MELERVPLDHLKGLLEQAERKFPVSSIWRHYKGQEFMVTGFDISEQTNDFYIRYGYPADVVQVLVNARTDKWGAPVNAVIAQAEFSMHIHLFMEPVETEDYSGERFMKVR
jgi:hypothetical protein